MRYGEVGRETERKTRKKFRDMRKMLTTEKALCAWHKLYESFHGPITELAPRTTTASTHIPSFIMNHASSCNMTELTCDMACLCFASTAARCASSSSSSSSHHSIIPTSQHPNTHPHPIMHHLAKIIPSSSVGVQYH